MHLACVVTLLEMSLRQVLLKVDINKACVMYAMYSVCVQSWFKD